MRKSGKYDTAALPVGAAIIDALNQFGMTQRDLLKALGYKNPAASIFLYAGGVGLKSGGKLNITFFVRTVRLFAYDGLPLRDLQRLAHIGCKQMLEDSPCVGLFVLDDVMCLRWCLGLLNSKSDEEALRDFLTMETARRAMGKKK